jgi:hypothetical protein
MCCLFTGLSFLLVGFFALLLVGYMMSGTKAV